MHAAGVFIVKMSNFDVMHRARAAQMTIIEINNNTINSPIAVNVQMITMHHMKKVRNTRIQETHQEMR